MSEVLIYYADGQEQRGPFTMQQLLAQGITANTMVWYEGLSGWTPACDAPLTAPYFGKAGQNPPPPGSAYNGYANNAYNGHNAYGNPRANMNSTRKPDDYLVWAILTTILCCLPFGVVSIVYASKVNSLWTAGQYDEARDASQKAKNWAIASAAVSAVCLVLYLFMCALPFVFL